MATEMQHGFKKVPLEMSSRLIVTVHDAVRTGWEQEQEPQSREGCTHSLISFATKSYDWYFMDGRR